MLSRQEAQRGHDFTLFGKNSVKQQVVDRLRHVGEVPCGQMMMMVMMVMIMMIMMIMMMMMMLLMTLMMILMPIILMMMMITRSCQSQRTTS